MQNTTSIHYLSGEIEYGYAYDLDFSEDILIHTHNGWEFLFVKSGELNYAVDGNVYDIAPNNLIISRPGAVHMLRPRGSILYERHRFTIAEHLLDKEILEQLPQALHVLDMSGNSIVLGLYEKVNFYLSNFREKHINNILRSLINELLMNIYVSKQTPSEAVESSSNPVITGAIQFIKEHIREPLTVHQISDALFITSGYLHQCFAKHMNMTPRKYIMIQKLQLVQQALADNVNLTEACRQYGFRSYSTFYRNYQKVYGYKPSDSPNQSLQKIEL